MCIIFISALTGQRVDKLYELINEVYRQNTLRVSTAVINDVINEAIAIVQPPTDKGKRLRVYYGTQATTKPPTFRPCDDTAPELYEFEICP